MNLNYNSETKWLPDGFHFLGPTESSNRRSLINQFTKYLFDVGYSEVTVPAFDYSVSFLNQISPEEEHSVLKLRDLQGREISPGTDLTVQVVKGMAGLSHIAENQKVFYVARRIRDHKKKNASRREVLQVGAECIGSSNPEDILRILQESDHLLKNSNLKKRPTIVLSNNRLIRSILSRLSLDATSINQLTYFIHTKNSSEILKFVQLFNLKKAYGDIIIELTHTLDIEKIREVLTSFAKQEDFDFSKDLTELSKVVKLWYEGDRFSDLCVDLSLVRDLKYYTGFLFQGFLESESEPVLTGGQYDNLYEIFSGKEMPACGFAIHIDTLESSLGD
ncbi:ATP phosphoribosyltransferase regulatory subunit [Leptospira sp. GIMC2001]|uniref:ATP phosphoribosyltransferase regulatory subunit n=1 Tax=Leptospira sp. GIMC2001 TaxID=1513297 RepID=UPI0023498609|nr:ATP phosphoribosyltransferase regulatory subunit [Leptospira sp. GIMC2001]WCL51112.1 ATP phosphoribosyltransferase regulatory subunit [Leptospira sp. GIMC2001]